MAKEGRSHSVSWKLLDGSCVTRMGKGSFDYVRPRSADADFAQDDIWSKDVRLSVCLPLSALILVNR